MNARRVPLVMGPQWLQVSPLVAKELHAILPMAFWGVVALALCVALTNQTMIVAVFPVVCAVLASQSAGHDFSNRTLASLLAQPVSRSRLWSLRMLLIACATGVLGLTTAVLMIGVFSRFRSYHQMSLATNLMFFATYIINPILNAICIAPLLTLLSRSVLFGTVFTIALPFALNAMIELGGKAVGLDGFELQPRQFQNFMLIPLWTAGALLGWRRFVTLEVIDGSGTKRVATARRAERGVSIGSPVWQLVKKEFMLQRMPIGMSVFAMGLTLFLNSDQTQLWTIVYPPMVIVLAGAVASADERSMGTLQWQILLPIPFWKQWGIKIGVTFLVALGFGVVGPGTVVLLKAGKLHAFLASPDGLEGIPWFLFLTLLVTAVTIYISSISESGLRAMMVSLATIVFYFVGGSWAVGKYMEYIREGIEMPIDLDLTNTRWIATAAVFVMVTGFAALMFTFAMNNHQSADRSEARIAKQCAWLIAYAATALCGLMAVVGLARIGP